MSEPLDDIEALCIQFHDEYERHAVAAGWETQQRSRVAWADVPEANKASMRLTVAAVCGPLLADLRHARTVVSFFSSVIKSGERWSDTCEEMMTGPGSDS